MQIDLLNQDKKKVGSVELSDAVFSASINIPLVHQVIKAQLAGRRQGTAKTKTKSEIRGGGRKPFRQKGTGNARQGSIRSPLHVGGGQSFGPVPRDYTQSTPKEMIRGALRSAISDRVKASRFFVVDQFQLAGAKTKVLNEILSKKWDLHKVLIVDDANKNLELSARNIPNVKVLRTEGLNVYDIVRYDWVIFTQGAAKSIETRLAP